MGVVIGLICVLALAGMIFYNPLRRKMDGIIGVGGAYAITIGLMCLGMAIGQLFSETPAASSEVIVAIVAMVICFAYMLFVMFTRCETWASRLLLPFAGFLIGMGFAGRFLLALVFRIPMEGSSPESDPTRPTQLPMSLYDENNDEWRWAGGEAGGYVEYECVKNGARVGFHTSAEGWLPTFWRVGG